MLRLSYAAATKVDILHARMKAGLEFSQAMPAFVATDSYGKHRILLSNLVAEVGGQGRIQCLGATPRGSAQSVAMATKEVTVIAGEPFHNVIAANKIVSPRANDAIDFLHDHKDTLCRLNAPPMPEDAARQATESAVPELAPEYHSLLQKAVEHGAPEIYDALLAAPQGARAIRAFLSSPAVRRAVPTWKAIFGAQPPRPVLARLARLCKATLPESCGYYNYSTRADFRTEVTRMKLWYRPGRRLKKRRGGLLRTRPGTSVCVRGRRSIWTEKMTAHYERLLHATYVEGLFKWQRCALALHRAKIPVQSGTLPVERHWSFFMTLLPAQTRAVKEDTFSFMADLAFLRYNCMHFQKPHQAAWARRDPVLAQKASEFLDLLHAAANGHTTSLEKEIVEACSKALKPEGSRKS